MRYFKYIQQQVRNFFGISTTEANAFLILLPLMTILLVLFPFYHKLIPKHPEQITAETEQFQKYIANIEKELSTKTDKNQVKIRQLSSFNPNNASFGDLISVGLDTISAATLIKFRNSGAVFIYKEDIKSVYGIDGETYINLYPKIDLPQKPLREPYGNRKLSESKEKNERSSYIKEVPENFSININKCDSIELMKIKGIGPVLSSRVVRYREMLGGFRDTVQFKEVYGIPPGTLEHLYKSAVIDSGFEPVKININTAGAPELAKHPYISWKLANAIVAYRNQHGRFESVEKLQDIKIIAPSDYVRMAPYLDIN